MGDNPDPMHRFRIRFRQSPDHQLHWNHLAIAVAWDAVAPASFCRQIPGAVAVTCSHSADLRRLPWTLVYAVIAAYFFQHARSFRTEVSVADKALDADMLAFVARI